MVHGRSIKCRAEHRVDTTVESSGLHMAPEALRTATPVQSRGSRWLPRPYKAVVRIQTKDKSRRRRKGRRITFTHRHDERGGLPRLRERISPGLQLTPELKVGVSL